MVKSWSTVPSLVVISEDIFVTNGQTFQLYSRETRGVMPLVSPDLGRVLAVSSTGDLVTSLVNTQL